MLKKLLTNRGFDFDFCEVYANLRENEFYVKH